MMYVDLIDVNW